jgi:streptogramin lyase
MEDPRMRRRLGFVTVLALTLAALVAAAPVAAQSNFPSRINLVPNGWQPEGITAGRGTTLYVGSLADGRIGKVNARTGAVTTLVAGVPGAMVAGVEYEARHNRLWVAGAGTHEVRVYNASSGALLQTYTFPGSGFLNDLVATRRAVYVTDSGSNQLRVVPLGPGGSLLPPSAATSLTMTGFPVVADQFNANGIVSKDGWLIVVNSFTGELFRVDPVSGTAVEIDLGGGSAASGDGLELRGATLYVVQNFLNQVAVFRLRNQLLSARQIGTITSAGLDIPTTVAFQAGRLWAVNARFTTPPTPDTEYWITRLPAKP